MSKKSISEGSIIAIPTEVGYVIAKILYVSEYFKNTALFKVYAKQVTTPESYAIAVEPDDFNLFYTGTIAIKKGTWVKVSEQALSEAEESFSNRIVGGDVWYKDECVRPASDSDHSSLPKMRVFNFKHIESKVAEYPLINGNF